MNGVSIIGCGFVADLYMRSFALYPRIKVLGAYDHDPDRLAAFCAHWKIPAYPNLNALLALTPVAGLVLNLTNPASHADVTRMCLNGGRHVWSEKPMVLDMSEALSLHGLATARRLNLASAPSSVLGEAAQTMGRAVRNHVAGIPRLVYAELDDGFISQAPVADWISESGAPWPYEDEFRTGCALEHAGYYLSWLISWFGGVKTVVSAASGVVPDKLGVEDPAPDLSVATLFFRQGPVARLTCSVAAPLDHRIRVIGDDGVLEVPEAWDNSAPVRYRRRVRIRRRLLESPFPRRIRISGETHPKVRRTGASAMNFALGPVEMLDAIAEGRQSRLSGDFALHLTEVTLACQRTGVHKMQTNCAAMEPMDWAR